MGNLRCRRVGPVFALLLLATALLGCRGDKITTVTLSGPGTSEGRYSSGPDVVLWADSDGEWQGTKSSKLSLVYDVEVFQAGAKVGQSSCETATPTTSFCGRSTALFGTRRAACEVLMRCELPATQPGEVVLRVTGRMGDPARTKRIDKMDVVVRKR